MVEKRRGNFNGLWAAALMGVLTSLCWRPLQAEKSQSSNESQVRSDAELQKAVENRLSLDPRVNAANIRVSSKDGHVTLSGTVDNLLDKEQALKYAEDIKGVKSINGNLGIKETDRTDAEIQKEITRHLTINPAVNSSDIKVNVKNSVVSLSGTVSSLNAKEKADSTAKNIDGVKQVFDNIQVAQQLGLPQHMDKQ